MNKTAYRAIWEIILAILFLISILFTLISAYECLDYFSDRTHKPHYVIDRYKYIGLTQYEYASRWLVISLLLITLLCFQLKYLVSRNLKQIISMIIISVICLFSVIAYEYYLNSISTYVYIPKG